jgi:hypothetical protein
VRIADDDLAAVILAIAGSASVTCDCSETSSDATSVLVTIDPDYDEGDPISLGPIQNHGHDNMAGPFGSPWNGIRMPGFITSAARATRSGLLQPSDLYQRSRPITSGLRHKLAQAHDGHQLAAENFGLEPKNILSEFAGESP